MSAHEAGALHAPGYGSVATVPAWLSSPTGLNNLVPRVWSDTVRRNAAGALKVGGLDVRDPADTYGTPVYVLDEIDFRARAVALRDAFHHAFRGSGRRQCLLRLQGFSVCSSGTPAEPRRADFVPGYR